MLDLLTAAPREVKFGERTLKLGALKLRELGLLQRWIRDHAEKPTDRLQRTLPFLEPEEHRAAKKAAVQAENDWPPAVGTAAGNEVLFHDLDGQLYFLSVMARKHNPELTDADINAIADGLSPADFGLLVMIAFGEDDFDPEVYRAAAGTVFPALCVALNELASEDPTGEPSSPGTSPGTPQASSPSPS